MGSGRIGLLALLFAAFGVSTSASPAQAAKLLPSRIFTCDIGHVVNFDASKRQTPTDLKFDTRHRFVFTLAGGPARTAPPPEPGDKPEKVNPVSRIVSDPDRIAPQHRAQFDQVVDYWPDRIELMGMIKGDLRNAIVIDSYDAAAGTANLFMLRATELTHFEQGHIYQGSCRVTLRAPVSRTT